ncbi:MAG TPA: GyrI-like domain-containing protein [Pilimelia sp.]|nr:GyrI-like domain-containing protein [Pilimelia sp.]
MTLTYQIEIRNLTDQFTAVVRAELPQEELPAWLAGTFGAVHDYLRRAGVAPTGPPFLRMAFLGATVAAEAGFPVPREIDGDDLVEPSTLPDGLAVVTTHMGPYEDLVEAHQVVQRWLDEHHCSPAGPHWEVYYTDPTAEPDPARWRTDLVQPFRHG